MNDEAPRIDGEAKADAKRADDQERKKNRRTRENAAIRDVMQSEGGRAFVWWVLEQAGIFKVSADISGTPNAELRTYFNEGRRNLGNELVVRLNQVDQELYQEMEREHRNRLTES